MSSSHNGQLQHFTQVVLMSFRATGVPWSWWTHSYIAIYQNKILSHFSTCMLHCAQKFLLNQFI